MNYLSVVMIDEQLQVSKTPSAKLFLGSSMEKRCQKELLEGDTSEIPSLITWGAAWVSSSIGAVAKLVSQDPLL